MVSSLSCINESSSQTAEDVIEADAYIVLILEILDNDRRGQKQSVCVEREETKSPACGGVEARDVASVPYRVPEEHRCMRLAHISRADEGFALVVNDKRVMSISGAYWAADISPSSHP